MAKKTTKAAGIQPANAVPVDSESLDGSEVLYVLPADGRLSGAGGVRKATVTRTWNPTCVNLKVHLEADDLNDEHKDERYVEHHLVEVSFRHRVLFDESGAPGTFSKIADQA